MIMVRELERIKIDDKEYYIDERLEELRNVNNPHDVRPLSDLEDEIA